MPTILALDPAWTATEPSGVALCRSSSDRWRYVAVAPNYKSFLRLAQGEAIDWDQPRFQGCLPDVLALLRAATQISGATVDLVTVDMPIATVPITGRREADRAVSREFGGRGCGTHSPSVSRPGPLGAKLVENLVAAGYPIGTATNPPQTGRQTLEVYPHPALLSLLPCDYRWQYKVSRSSRYWKDATPAERTEKLLPNLGAIRTALSRVFGPLGVPLPTPGSAVALSRLKRYEDALNALVCAWVGVKFLARETVPLGDETAAIWCPRDVVRVEVASARPAIC